MLNWFGQAGLMLDRVVIEKGETIDRAVKRAREELSAASDFFTDFTRQDAAVVNIQRACEAAIDIGNRLLLIRHLGHAAENKAIFEKLQHAGLIDAELARRMIGMVGFRNVAVHSYRKLNLRLVEEVIEKHLDDLLAFASVAVRASETP